jgi:hypothetical protein
MPVHWLTCLGGLNYDFIPMFMCTVQSSSKKNFTKKNQEKERALKISFGTLYFVTAFNMRSASKDSEIGIGSKKRKKGGGPSSCRRRSSSKMTKTERGDGQMERECVCCVYVWGV